MIEYRYYIDKPREVVITVIGQLVLAILQGIGIGLVLALYGYILN